MTSEKRRALLFVITLAMFLIASVIESYGGSASIEYQYDAVGNVLEKKMTYSDFPPPQPITCWVYTYPNFALQFLLDNTQPYYTAPHSFEWTVGSSHILWVESPQSGGSGIRYIYSSWYPPGGGGQNNTITVPASNCSYTAYFTTQYSLTTSASPLQGGTVTPSGESWYDSGQQNVWVTANPSPGYSLSNWSGNLGGSTNPASLTMDGPKNVTANFTQNQTGYTLTTSVSPSGSGSITKYPDKPTYAPGDQVTLTAEASTSYSFSSWSGDISGNTNVTTIIMNSSKVVTATFTGCSNLPFKVGSQYYSDLQSAYNAAGDSATIQCRGVKVTGNLTVNRPVAGVTVQGGYDCGYSANSGNMTFLKGTITTTTTPPAGSITIGNVILEQ